MAITYTTHRWNNETNRPETTGSETTHAGVVLAKGSGHRHVCSDNAMIDSGYYVTADVWTGDRIEVLTFDLGRNDDSVAIEIDAPAELQEKADAYRKAMALVAKIERAFDDLNRQARQNQKIRVGQQVEVFKGRKLAKGIYWVRYIGEGNYGPYCHLSNTKTPEVGSKVFNYINPENCRVHNPEQVAAPYSSTVREMAKAVIDHSQYDAKVNVDAFAPLHDALFEDGKVEDAAELDAYLFLVLAVAV